MLLASAALGERRRLVSGALAPLADSLARDLDRLTHTADIYIPQGKARLTRAGGRCPRCGGTLDFDPWSPQRHRCSRCQIELTGDDHDAMWIMWYQLWLAERAVHAAALYATRGDAAHRSLAERILGLYAERYLSYPNTDNVLGPTRIFFSTYLESIWTLQLACALDLLETTDGSGALGAAVRDRLLEPSATLIELYDEGLSNRQVWNNAALLACGALLGNVAQAERAIMGPFGLRAHLQRALLADGTWYEGENYHLFAHRGLWYGVTLADAAGLEIPADLRARYQCGFETPFLTALPDFTFPSRRDSQYRVSLRQWRIAESCELGLALTPRPVLAAALRELYRADIPLGDTGRDRSTAEAERNMPPSRLTRGDLGWKSLLFASERPTVDVSSAPTVGSVLLAHQGFAVMRRGRDRVYVALDYGESGGGHGHPDRLNLWLVVGEARILEDVGTGSYVDPSLHWYRSTLAHNAPLAGGESQRRTAGDLLAFDERGEFGWTLARASLTPNVDAERAVVLAANYIVDELLWTGGPGTVMDLPLHVMNAAAAVSSWTDGTIQGGTGLEDGFSHIVHSSVTAPQRSVFIRGHVNGLPVNLWLLADSPFTLWRLRGPGPPNEQARSFFLVRSSGSIGRLRTVIDWSDAIDKVDATDEALVVTRHDGSRHTHSRRETDWHVATGEANVVLTRGKARLLPHAAATLPTPVQPTIAVPLLESVSDRPGELTHDGRASRFALGEEHYRRSEESWEEAGRPTATIAFAATSTDVHVDISVQKATLAMAPAQSANSLDNEHPDINSDGVQLYLGGSSWLAVPEAQAPNVRVTSRHAQSGCAPTVHATWAPTSSGYGLRITIPQNELTQREPILGDVIVNETLPGRERRRGQLVLSGARGEWVYLRGDRQDSSRFFNFVVADA